MLANHHQISPQQAGTLYGLFCERVVTSPDKVAYHFYADDSWQTLTWSQINTEVARWQAALAKLPLNVGDRVGIMLRNSPWWVMFDMAAMSLGLVTVPLYTQDRPDNVAYIVQDADIKVLLFEREEQWSALSAVLPEMKSVISFVSINPIASDCPRLISIAQFLPEQANIQAAKKVPTEQLASLIYTSGTTGRPKGVMLSHANMLSNAAACLSFFPVSENDILLSFLPLSHTFERTLGYYLTIMAGAEVAFARSIPQLSEDLLIIRPTLLVSVPRIYERIASSVHTKLSDSPALVQMLFKLAIDIGWTHFLHQQKQTSWSPSFLLLPLLRKIVAEKVLQRLGGRLRTALSGGAALSPEVARLFIGLGLPIIQGYGMTETSPVICSNRLNDNVPASVGLPIPGIEVKQGEHGELLVRGPNVMLGYWHLPEATAQIIDHEGWLNTGDVVRFDEAGHVFITGRTKEIIVMSNGEKIPPSDMEMAISQHVLFDQVMVVGEARPYLSALIVLNPEEWQKTAICLGLDYSDDQALLDVSLHISVLTQIKQSLSTFPGYARIHRVCLLREAWNIDNGLLTPTLKLKRKEISQRFTEQINAMYQGHC